MNETLHRLPTSSHHRLEAIFRFGEALWHQREDLRSAFPEVDSPEYWYWLMWHGSDGHAEIRDNLYAIPDRHLMSRVVGEASAQDFLRGGLVNWRRVLRCLTAAGHQPAAGGTLLDFGCGCGRILRHFAFYAHASDLHGVDVDREAVAWCADHLDFASFTAVRHQPPTPFAAATFDAVYAYSVFSHLPEAAHRRWLEELHRITRPGAILVLTVQGRKVIELSLSGERDLGHPTAAELRAELAEIESRGFAFFPYEHLELQNDQNHDYYSTWDLQEYGMTFITEAYIRARWTDLFSLQAHYPAPEEWQDFVVLRRE